MTMQKKKRGKITKNEHLVGLKLNDKTYAALKVYALERGQNMADIVRALILNFLESKSRI